MTATEIAKSRLHVIHYSSNTDLPLSVRDSVPDAVAQTIFRVALNAALADGKTEMHSYIRAYKQLEDAGYARNADKVWEVKKDSPGLSNVHVDRPLGAIKPDKDEEEDSEFADGGALPGKTYIVGNGDREIFIPRKSFAAGGLILEGTEYIVGERPGETIIPKYLPPLEVHQAAKSAYDVGMAVLDITSVLAEGGGLAEPGIREIAKHFSASESATESETSRNAWGGPYAKKWALRVLKRINKDADHDKHYPPHILVDLDNTLAEKLESYDGTAIGMPLEPMFSKVKQALKDGKAIKIFTARVADDPDGKIKKAIEAWCKMHLGEVLPVTNEKDPGMTELWDDKAHNPDEIEKVGSGVLISFWLDPVIADKLKVDGGEKPEEMHMTLLYMGKDVPEERLPELESIVADFAASHAPVVGAIAGPIRFPACENTEGRDVCAASFENPDIQDFRRALKEQVEQAGFTVK